MYIAVVSMKILKRRCSIPIVSTESIFITLAIDAHERRGVATSYIPGKFLHADLENHIIMVFKGKLALLLCHVYPKLYRKYNIFDKRRKPVLYVKIHKVLY